MSFLDVICLCFLLVRIYIVKTPKYAPKESLQILH